MIVGDDAGKVQKDGEVSFTSFLFCLCNSPPQVAEPGRPVFPLHTMSFIQTQGFQDGLTQACPDIPVLPTHLWDHLDCETPPPTSSHGAACQGTVTEQEGSMLWIWAASLQSLCVLSLMLGVGDTKSTCLVM